MGDPGSISGSGWRKERQPIPVFLPGKSPDGGDWQSMELQSYNPWSCRVGHKRTTITIVDLISLVARLVMNLPVNAADAGSFTGSGRSPGGGHGNALQYSCLENPMDRGAWRATVHGVTKSQIRLSN